MNKSARIWLIVAASLILIGSMIFAGIMFMLKWDFIKLSTNKYETNSYDIKEDCKNISITTNTSNVEIVPSENMKTSVVCYEQKNINHSVAVKDGILVIEVSDTRKWYERIGINFESSKITVYLPAGEFGALTVKASTGHVEAAKDFKFESINISTGTGDVKNYASASEIKIKATTGDISVDGISAGSVELSVSTGRINASNIVCDGNITVKVSTGKAELEDVSCKNLISSGSTGDIELDDVIASGSFSIDRSTGAVELEDCDAAELYIKTSTGDVEGTLLSEKVFVVNTDTGKKDVPSTITGGRCEITTDTGDIKISIK